MGEAHFRENIGAYTSQIWLIWSLNSLLKKFKLVNDDRIIFMVCIRRALLREDVQIFCLQTVDEAKAQ